MASAREALIAELMGQLEELVHRVEALPATLDNAREAMNRARWDLHCQVDPLHHQMAAAIQQSKDIALKEIQVATYQFAADSMARQTEAMKEVAREVVGKEIRPSLQEFANSLDRLAKRVDRQWLSWSTHGATVLATAVGTAILLIHFFGK